MPNYFVGRKDGPAEFANLGERGPELVGQEKTGYRLIPKPTVGYLRAGDRVYTAPETQQLLRQNELVEGRIQYRAQQADMERQTVRLRSGAVQQQAAEARAVRQSNNEVLAELREVRRAIKEQEYYRLNEHGDLVRSRKVEDSRQDSLNKRNDPRWGMVNGQWVQN